MLIRTNRIARKILSIESEFDEPFVDVVSGFADMGLDKNITCQVIGISTYTLDHVLRELRKEVTFPDTADSHFFIEGVDDALSSMSVTLIRDFLQYMYDLDLFFCQTQCNCMTGVNRTDSSILFGRYDRMGLIKRYYDYNKHGRKGRGKYFKVVSTEWPLKEEPLRD